MDVEVPIEGSRAAKVSRRCRRTAPRPGFFTCDLYDPLRRVSPRGVSWPSPQQMTLDVADVDAGVDEPCFVFKSGGLVDIVRELQVADLVGEQLLGDDAELLACPVLMDQQAGKSLGFVKGDVSVGHTGRRTQEVARVQPGTRPRSDLLAGVRGCCASKGGEFALREGLRACWSSRSGAIASPTTACAFCTQ